MSHTGPADAFVSRAQRGTWLFLAVLLTANVPLFLCRHLTPDAALYDLQARLAFDGGVLYRDIVEPNFPGVVWVHMLVRGAAGWSTVSLRAFDLAIVTGIVLLSARLIGEAREPKCSTRTAGVSLLLFGLYFSLTEWCHCQRDVWMLCPALGAAALRARRIHAILASTTGSDRSGGSLLEGILWGIAFWLKPHVALPALAVIGVSAPMIGNRRRFLRDVALIGLGGLLVGAIGSCWMIRTGAWPHFWEMQLEWNPEYLRAGRKRLTFERFASLWQTFAPWGWLHLLAIPVAAVRAFSVPARDEDTGTTPEHRLLAAMYLGWLVQALLLQHPFAYVHMPPAMLAITVVCAIRVPVHSIPLAKAGALAFGVLAAMSSPALSPALLRHWGECFRSGPTPELRAAIQLERSPDWAELKPVLHYIAGLNLGDGELTVLPGTAVTVYRELELRPSTRFVYLDALARLFPERTDAIQAAVANSGHKVVVSSLRDAGMPESEIAQPNDPTTGLPHGFPKDRLSEFPYTQPVVFRSGAYCVHRVTGPPGPICTEYLPLRTATSSRETVTLDTSGDAPRR